MIALTYISLSLAAVCALSVMILRIGALMVACPENGPAVRVATVTVATGFGAIGTGGAILIGALLPLLPSTPLASLLLALGLAALCLGLGFTQAVATLRAVLMPAAPPQPVVP